MKYSYIILFFFLISCTQNFSNLKNKKSLNTKGFAYIYKDSDFIKTIRKKFDNNSLQIGHNKLRPGTLVRIINLQTNDSIVLKIVKDFNIQNFINFDDKCCSRKTKY